MDSICAGAVGLTSSPAGLAASGGTTWQKSGGPKAADKSTAENLNISERRAAGGLAGSD